MNRRHHHPPAAQSADPLHAAPEPPEPDHPSCDLTEAVAELRRMLAAWLRDLSWQARTAQGDAAKTAYLLGRLDSYAEAATGLDEETTTPWNQRGRRHRTERTRSAPGPQPS